MDIIDRNHRIVYDTYKVFLCEALLLTSFSPFLLHLQSNPLYHASKHLSRVRSLFGLSVADIEKHIDTLYLHHCAFLLQTGPRNADVDFLNMAEA